MKCLPAKSRSIVSGGPIFLTNLSLIQGDRFWSSASFDQMPFALQPFSQHTKSIRLLTHWLFTKWQGDSFVGKKLRWPNVYQPNDFGPNESFNSVSNKHRIGQMSVAQMFLAKCFWPNASFNSLSTKHYFGQMSPWQMLLAKWQLICVHLKLFGPNVSRPIFFTKWQGYCCTHKTVYWPNAC